MSALSIDKNKKIGSGRTAEVYELTDDTIVKLFFPQFGTKIAEVEYSLHKAISKSGLPIPKVYDLTTVGDRPAIIYQKLIGESLLDVIKRSPTNIKKLASDMADLHYDIGAAKAPEELPSFKERILSGIDSQNLVTDTKKEMVISILEKLPEGESICHADFHPDNIIISKGKYWVIDWVTACSGSFTADYTRSNMILKYSVSPNASMYEKVLSKAFGGLFSKLYTNRLIKSGMELTSSRKWQLPIMTARLAENISTNENATLLKLISRSLN